MIIKNNAKIIFHEIKTFFPIFNEVIAHIYIF